MLNLKNDIDKKYIYWDVILFVELYETCQTYSNIRHWDSLHRIYLLAIHFKWFVDLVIMPIELWQMKYLVLNCEDLLNQVEGRALKKIYKQDL